MKKYNYYLSLFVLYLLINMVLFPQIYIQATLNGISAWTFNVLPSILPFIFFTKILSSLNVIEKTTEIFEKPFAKIFKTPAISSFVFISSIISGYPVGAKLTAELYQNGKITKNDAFKMMSFCSTSGPMFIIGAVGIGMLKSYKIGVIIFVSHILGAILNGVLYRNRNLINNKTLPTKTSKSSNFDLSTIVYDSAISVISIGVIIAVFFVIITSLSPVFNILPPALRPIFEGFIEITKGCLTLSSTNLTPLLKTTFTTTIVSFGGLSTFLQSLVMLEKLEINKFRFFFQKLTQAIVSFFVSFILCFILL